jgi:hypothetical protein
MAKTGIFYKTTVFDKNMTEDKNGLHYFWAK